MSGLPAPLVPVGPDAVNADAKLTWRPWGLASRPAGRGRARGCGCARRLAGRPRPHTDEVLRSSALASCPWFGCFIMMIMMWQCHLSSSECHCCLNGFSLCKRLPVPLSAGSRALEQSVGAWLAALGLQQYESRLLLNGFDDVRFLVSAGLRGVGAAPTAG